MSIRFETVIEGVKYTLSGFKFFDHATDSYHVRYHAYNESMQRMEPSTIPGHLHQMFLSDVQTMFQGLDQYRYT